MYFQCIFNRLNRCAVSGTGSPEGGGATAEERGEGGRKSDRKNHEQVGSRRRVDRFDIDIAAECRLALMGLITILLYIKETWDSLGGPCVVKLIISWIRISNSKDFVHSAKL